MRENSPRFVAEDPEAKAESDDADETSGSGRKLRRVIPVGEFFVTQRDGMGEKSRKRDSGSERSIGEVLVNRRPEQEAGPAPVDAPGERDTDPGVAAATETEEQKAEPAAPSGEAVTEAPAPVDNQRAETIEQPPAQSATETEPPYDYGPASTEALPEEPQRAELPHTPVPEEQTPKAAEKTLMMWTREQESQLPEGRLYEGEAIWAREADLRPPDVSPAPQEAAQEVVAAEVVGPKSVPVPTAAELEALTGITPHPALQPRVVRPAGSRTRPSRQNRPPMPPVPAAAFAANTPPVSPNVPPSGYNNAGLPNLPPNPNTPPPGGNMNTPPPPPGGLPPGPPGNPPSPGMNPNNGGNWNPAQVWSQTAPNVAPGVVGNTLPAIPVPPVETVRGTGGAFLGGFLIGRYLFSGRRKLKRQMRQGFKERDKKLARIETDRKFAQAEQADRQAQAAREQARLNRELASTRQQLGSVEQRGRELEEQHGQLTQQMEADRRKTQETARAAQKAEKAEKTMKARAAQRFRSARSRFERFSKTAEQAQGTQAGMEQLVAQDGNKLVRSGWVTNEMDSKGRVIDDAESVIKHGQAFHRERAIERGVAAKSQTAGEMALLAAATAAGNGRSGNGGTAGGDSASLPYISGAGSAYTRPDASGVQQQPAQPGAPAYTPFDRQKRVSGPVWPYLLTLFVILVCLIALLR